MIGKQYTCGPSMVLNNHMRCNIRELFMILGRLYSISVIIPSYASGIAHIGNQNENI